MYTASRIALTFLVLVMVVALAIVVTHTPGPPDKVRSFADSYARYASLAAPETITVRQITHASSPWNFTRDMSTMTFGDSVYYRTVYSLPKLAAGTSPATPDYGERPVPFSPQAVWCVLLSNDKTVIVAQHQDMYNADWILHEVVDAGAVAAQVSCKTD